jgi:hypothetical protein|nr:hypothetical protein [Kofleriaceae bacterium]
MTPLANAIYKLLVRRLRAGALSITYGDLSAALPARVATHQRSRNLHGALCEVSRACHARQLPRLPAMVWRADRKRPGPIYFGEAHPRLRSVEAQRAAWELEHAAVVAAAARYPAALS